MSCNIVVPTRASIRFYVLEKVLSDILTSGKQAKLFFIFKSGKGRMSDIIFRMSLSPGLILLGKCSRGFQCAEDKIRLQAIREYGHLTPRQQGLFK